MSIFEEWLKANPPPDLQAPVARWGSYKRIPPDSFFSRAPHGCNGFGWTPKSTRLFNPVVMRRRLERLGIELI